MIRIPTTRLPMSRPRVLVTNEVINTIQEPAVIDAHAAVLKAEAAH
ncbi:hypothetical protein [Paeniglutamicibacter gangotriensis]|nr:hypothetical protein [Paeniglutamicibacter gangotriensis]